MEGSLSMLIFVAVVVFAARWLVPEVYFADSTACERETVEELLSFGYLTLTLFIFSYLGEQKAAGKKAAAAAAAAAAAGSTRQGGSSRRVGSGNDAGGGGGSHDLSEEASDEEDEESEEENNSCDSILRVGSLVSIYI
mmetsp:Transcript_88150/g.184193  ORF Transcript_88150/g.184193 Transcript_88150/m.184193 type:complete len:138 (-) Transcript_88150:49-462(-)|eukprot:CAMPEP_0206453760 /NCGR_PEP_ID=MMETSP0324_2-20121206/20739_1 /ASSEMBLY_ACC=CAM_ASM_000836 /TAXON_ID=2866 /ORGANISM="Crypthecodinium cohnii, Strain Seligo" /LENGTH=137 /DNA_ID=CAMNT_0053924115 /DNA_START=113 /DNA_END=526 /DNA_ORIENTATION=+